MTDQIKVLYWNIHGISSKVTGEKHKDPRLTGIIAGYDVVCLSELHSDKKIRYISQFFRGVDAFPVKKKIDQFYN